MRYNEFNNKTKKITKHFINWVTKRLELSPEPKIILNNDKDKVKNLRTFGTTNTGDGSIWVYVGDRNTADILRTIAHEMVHFRQYLRKEIHVTMNDKDKKRIEDEANSIAGRLLRDYGKINVHIY